MMDKLKDFFENRDDALSQLIGVMEGVNLANTLVLSISEEGAILAEGIAKHFNLPLEHLFLSPISAPENPDCVIALVSETMEMVIDENLIEAFDISVEDVYNQAKRQYEQKLLPQTKQIRQDQPLISFVGKNILIVDEGVETGFSAEVAIKTCVANGCKSASIATPVLSSDVERYLLKLCDCVYSVLYPAYFVSTNYYYKELPTPERKECFFNLN